MFWWGKPNWTLSPTCDSSWCRRRWERTFTAITRQIKALGVIYDTVVYFVKKWMIFRLFSVLMGPFLIHFKNNIFWAMFQDLFWGIKTNLGYVFSGLGAIEWFSGKFLKHCYISNIHLPILREFFQNLCIFMTFKANPLCSNVTFAKHRGWLSPLC